AGAGVTASVVADGDAFRLEIVKDDGAPVAIGNDSSSLLSGLAVAKEPLLIERTSNTVSDLFSGVTMNLYQAEPGSTVRIDVDRDLNAVKTALTAFVQAYNAVKTFINGQNLTDSSTGEKASGAGPLFGSRALATVSSALGGILGGGTQGVDEDY